MVAAKWSSRFAVCESCWSNATGDKAKVTAREKFGEGKGEETEAIRVRALSVA